MNRLEQEIAERKQESTGVQGKGRTGKKKVA